jgi:hypothetical protein
VKAKEVAHFALSHFAVGALGRERFWPRTPWFIQFCAQDSIPTGNLGHMLSILARVLILLALWQAVGATYLRQY